MHLNQQKIVEVELVPSQILIQKMENSFSSFIF